MSLMRRALQTIRSLDQTITNGRVTILLVLIGSQLRMPQRENTTLVSWVHWKLPSPLWPILSTTISSSWMVLRRSESSMHRGFSTTSTILEIQILVFKFKCQISMTLAPQVHWMFSCPRVTLIQMEHQASMNTALLQSDCNQISILTSEGPPREPISLESRIHPSRVMHRTPFRCPPPRVFKLCTMVRCPSSIPYQRISIDST
mmetsp:Transcript_10541/g.39203  ORF Transcript_10541/g.39203 Transcript_10541/m.39203 type:complete len:203 (-) Transcript_10541:2498-3106(-)